MRIEVPRSPTLPNGMMSPRSCGRLYSRSLFHFKRNSGLVCKFTPSYATRAPGGPSKTRKPPQTLSDPPPLKNMGAFQGHDPSSLPLFLFAMFVTCWLKVQAGSLGREIFVTFRPLLLLSDRNGWFPATSFDHNATQKTS